jgi:hypothetical protein
MKGTSNFIGNHYPNAALACNVFDGTPAIEKAGDNRDAATHKTLAARPQRYENNFARGRGPDYDWKGSRKMYILEC